MPLIIPAGFAQISYLSDGAATPNGAAFTLGVDNQTSLLSLSDIADAAQIAFNSADWPTVTAAGGDVIRVKIGPNATGASGDFNLAWAGISAADASPPNTAILVRKVTAQGGRAGRGRFFLAGPADAQVVDGGAIASATLPDFQASADAMYASLVAADLPPVLFHTSLVPYNTPTPIDSFQVDGRVATQRRRLRG